MTVKRSVTVLISAGAGLALLAAGTTAGAAIAVLLTVLLALVVAYPCSRFQVVGHYFGLVTLAVGEVIRLLIVAERDWTGGSLGVTLKTGGAASDWWTLQFADKRVFYYVGLAAWLFGLWVWWRVDRTLDGPPRRVS